MILPICLGKTQAAGNAMKKAIPHVASHVPRSSNWNPVLTNTMKNEMIADMHNAMRNAKVIRSYFLLIFNGITPFQNDLIHIEQFLVVNGRTLTHNNTIPRRIAHKTKVVRRFSRHFR